MVVGRRTYNPPRSWYVCSYHLKRGATVCSNGVGVPVDDVDGALLDAIEKAVLTPEALTYLVTKAEEAIRQSLAQDPAQIEALRRRRVDTQRKVTRLIEAVAEGQRLSLPRPDYSIRARGGADG
jgi:hypothetical protein